MEQKEGRASRAGGAIIAFSILAGAAIGIYFGQPSIGTLAGTVAGIAISVALYLYDRRRS